MIEKIINFILNIYECPFDFFLGLSCPGCGMTRAFLSLLNLNIRNAFYYHPLFPLVILVAIIWLLKFFHIITLNKKWETTGLFIVCGIFIVTYFIRLSTTPEIVYWHYEDGFLFRAFSWLRNHILPLLLL